MNHRQGIVSAGVILMVLCMCLWPVAVSESISRKWLPHQPTAPPSRPLAVIVPYALQTRCL